MSVVVSFLTPKGVGSVSSPGIGDVRVRETLALNGTTTAAANEGEVVIIGNTETSMVFAAFGTTPNAAASASTSATSAGFPIGAGQVTGAILLKKGDKVNVKALS